ncbi:MAG: hypothetical protein E3J72_03520 [Planctomycetota bacterium]|nr:MAG: hypothetical protein E3J72_03520 [Planctomycetota bacterium]
MNTAVTFEYQTNGSVKMKVTGKLIGHKARNGLDLLKSVVEQGHRDIILDLRECTSTDSLGDAILEWIHTQNGSLSVNVMKSIFSTNVISAFN